LVSIAALGIARSYCYESLKSTEFGTAGSYWEAIGWKIDVSFCGLNSCIHPKSRIGERRDCCRRSTHRCAPTATDCRACTWPKSAGHITSPEITPLLPAAMFDKGSQFHRFDWSNVVSTL
jgi:hypothetical protein